MIMQELEFENVKVVKGAPRSALLKGAISIFNSDAEILGVDPSKFTGVLFKEKFFDEKLRNKYLADYKPFDNIEVLITVHEYIFFNPNADDELYLEFKYDVYSVYTDVEEVMAMDMNIITHKYNQ